MAQLRQFLSKNLPLHAILANEITQTPYGTITVNVEVKDGVAQLNTLNLVKNRRKRYKGGVAEAVDTE